MIDTTEILGRLKTLREEKGLKQEDLARELGIDRTTFLRKEKGHIPISTEEWLVMANALGKDPCCFFSSNNVGETDGPGRDATEKEEQLLSLYRELTDEERRDILFSIHLILKGVPRKGLQRELKRLLEE